MDTIHLFVENQEPFGAFPRIVPGSSVEGELTISWTCGQTLGVRLVDKDVLLAAGADDWLAVDLPERLTVPAGACYQVRDGSWTIPVRVTAAADAPGLVVGRVTVSATDAEPGDGVAVEPFEVTFAVFSAYVGGFTASVDSTTVTMVGDRVTIPVHIVNLGNDITLFRVSVTTADASLRAIPPAEIILAAKGEEASATVDVTIDRVRGAAFSSADVVLTIHGESAKSREHVTGSQQATVTLADGGRDHAIPGAGVVPVLALAAALIKRRR